MKASVAARIALAIWLVTVLLTGGAAFLLLLNRSTWEDPQTIFSDAIGVYLLSVSYTTLGLVVLRRSPNHGVGWSVSVAGLLAAISAFGSEYTIHTFVVAPGSLPLAAAIAWVQSVAFFPLVFPYGIGLLLFLFPDGRPPGRRWVPAFWVATAAAALVFVFTCLARGEISSNFREFPTHVENPVGIIPYFSKQSSGGAMYAVLMAWLLVAGASIVARLRRAQGAERQQLKWLVYAGLLAVLGFVLGTFPVPFLPGSTSGNLLFSFGVAGACIGIPAAMGIAILRYRLYDIDLVINKTLVYGALAVCITLLYVGIVAGFGYVVGSGRRPNLLLSIVATAIVAFAFQPLRRWLQEFVNQLIYGRRASPYEILSDFSTVAGSYAQGDILTSAARVLAEGTRATSATVWLRRDGRLYSAASWPHDGDRRFVPLAARDLKSRLGAREIAEVRFQGGVLGMLSIKSDSDLSPVEQDLLRNLAVQAGPVLHNVGLREELAARLEELSRQEVELRESRQRIVTAQDTARRRLERNIHDGAQQHLVALAVKLRLARTLIDRSPERAAAMISELEGEIEQAQQTLRELARGIYPPVLRDRGLEAALRAEAKTMHLDFELSCESVGRYDPEIEGAVYFCCLEALQNAAKHAAGAHVRIDIREAEAHLAFSIRDDGPGFDSASRSEGSGLGNMRDRIESVGGRLLIDSAAGHGTSITGSVPIDVRVAA